MHSIIHSSKKGIPIFICYALNSAFTNKFLLQFESLSSHLHSVLPANGAPVSRQRTSRVKEMYTEYVREKTMQNWKFWIVSTLTYHKLC